MRGKLTPEAKAFIDNKIKSRQALNYTKLAKSIAQRYGVQISKATISKRAKALKLKFQRGRKRVFPPGRRPAHSIFLDCAGAFFLKGAELETGLLAAINQLLVTSTESAKAKRTLRLAQQLNALLLYAPVFNLETAQDIVGHKGRTLPYLAGQEGTSRHAEIEQYLRFLADQRLLPPAIKEVTKGISAEALFVQMDFVSRGAGQRFYLDAQGRTVWPDSKIPRSFSATLYKVRSYIKDIFQSPSPQRPLILQTVPGYTFLPPEMFNLIQCFEQTEDKPISRIAVVGKFGENLAFWQGLKPQGKCFFIAPLSPWQYARVQGTQIVRDFQQYCIGPQKEQMAIADAKVRLFNPALARKDGVNSQLNTNIEVRAVLVRRKAERLALITNISCREERYIRKIAEQYFWCWPAERVDTYYDLLEKAHKDKEVIGRSGLRGVGSGTLVVGQSPLNAFRSFLEHLNHYALNHFFPSEYGAEGLTSMGEKFYRQCGFLKIRQNYWEVILRPFAQKDLQKDCRIACQRFNQSNIRLPDRKHLHIHLC